MKLLPLGILALLSLVACGSPQAPPARPEGAPPAAVASPRGQGPPLGPLTMQTPSGGTVELRPGGAPLTLVEVWSPTWFEGADEQFQRLEEIHERWGNRGVRVLAVAYDVATDQVRDAVKRHGALFDVGLGNPETYERLDVQALPTTWLVDREGRVLERLEGYQPLDALEKHLERLLAPEP